MRKAFPPSIVSFYIPLPITNPQMINSQLHKNTKQKEKKIAALEVVICGWAM
jgi:hypothetical protein